MSEIIFHMQISPYLENIFGKTAQLTVLEYLLNNKDNDTYLSGIAFDTGLSHSTVSRVIEPLLEQEIITEKSLGKQIRIFELNQKNELTQYLLTVYNDLKTMTNHEGGKQ